MPSEHVQVIGEHATHEGKELYRVRIVLTDGEEYVTQPYETQDEQMDMIARLLAAIQKATDGAVTFRDQGQA